MRQYHVKLQGRLIDYLRPSRLVPCTNHVLVSLENFRHLTRFLDPNTYVIEVILSW